MDTIELTLAIPLSEHERYLAWLEDVATGFVQKDGELRAYVPAHRWPDFYRGRLEARLAADGYPAAVTVKPLAAKNWNEIWEENLSPLRIGPYLVTPTSVDRSGEEEGEIVIRIDPEMSFGTGHHATTRLALQLLEEAVNPGDRVLDVGTGTGILAIAACKRDAASVTAVDTNPDAVRNARENARKNNVAECVAIEEGSTEVVPEMEFDVVAANVTRRILIDLLPDLASRLSSEGSLVLSGVLQADREAFRHEVEPVGLEVDREASEDGWWAARLTLHS